MADSLSASARILEPVSLVSAIDVASAPSVGGLYGWWFRRGSLDVPEADYPHRDGHDLLYVGISPSRAASAGTLRTRLRQHVSGNASQSTLRRTLGVLLTAPLGLELGLHNGRPTYGAEGETRVTGWMHENARVAWVAHPTPWVVEAELLASAVLALNLDGRDDDFVRSLSMRRRAALAAARRA